MQQAISTTYKYTSKKENTPTNRGLFHDFSFSLGYDNLQQDGISEAVGSLRVFYIRLARGLPVLIADISVTGCTVTTPVIFRILKFTVIVWS
ncbi:hypothetical protein [Bacteroides sp. f07]|uniref:hypothetical protein n=1 Tax=Bacteroides sp. f07 TaxID=3132704 RepID=UPI0036F242E3